MNTDIWRRFVSVCRQEEWFLMLRIMLSRMGISKPARHHRAMLLVAFWVT